VRFWILTKHTNGVIVCLKANIEKLVEAGLVEATGNNRTRSYLLSSKVYKKQENVVGYVRQMGITSVKHEA